jgi:hypothetical protein
MARKQLLTHLLNALEHKVVMAHIGIGECVGEAKEHRQGQFEPIGLV